MMKLVRPSVSLEAPVLKGMMDSWLQVEMKNHYTDRRPVWGEARPVAKGWTPSSVGYTNDRLVVAGLLGYRGEVISQKLQRIFDAGNDIEDRWIKRFKALGVYIDNNVWIPRTGVEGLEFSGKMDALVRHPYEAGRRFVVEIKSISPIGFEQLPRVSMSSDVNYANLQAMRGDVGDRMRRYLLQLQLYLVCTGDREGLLLMDNKGNQDFRDYYIESKPDVIATLRERLLMLQEEYWAKELIPPWLGSSRSKDIMATYRSGEVVSLAEMREVVETHGDGSDNAEF